VNYFSNEAHAGLTLNLATAYPAEVGITRWMRRIELDRRADSFLLEEDFQLKTRAPVVLSFMTPRTPSPAVAGSLSLVSTDKAAKDVTLKFDPARLTATCEKIDLTNPGSDSPGDRCTAYYSVPPRRWITPCGNTRWFDFGDLLYSSSLSP